MGNPLQEPRTATELASVSQVIEFAESISAFASLVNIVEADLSALDAERMPEQWRESTVIGRLEFAYVDAKGKVPTVFGSAVTDVAVVCQRCLEPFELQLTVQPKLLLLTADEVVEGYDDYEVWELAEETLRPLDIVEELLVMAMPLAAMHDNTTDCKALVSGDSSSDDLVRPFAALRAQMVENKTDSD